MRLQGGGRVSHQLRKAGHAFFLQCGIFGMHQRHVHEHAADPRQLAGLAGGPAFAVSAAARALPPKAWVLPRNTLRVNRSSNIASARRLCSPPCTASRTAGPNLASICGSSAASPSKPAFIAVLRGPARRQPVTEPERKDSGGKAVLGVSIKGGWVMAFQAWRRSGSALSREFSLRTAFRLAEAQQR